MFKVHHLSQTPLTPPLRINSKRNIILRQKPPRTPITRLHKHPTPYNKLHTPLILAPHIHPRINLLIHLGVHISVPAKARTGHRHREGTRPVAAQTPRRDVVLRGEGACHAGLELGKAVVGGREGGDGAAEGVVEGQGDVAGLFAVGGVGAGADEGLVGVEAEGYGLAVLGELGGEGAGGAAGAG